MSDENETDEIDEIEEQTEEPVEEAIPEEIPAQETEPEVPAQEEPKTENVPEQPAQPQNLIQEIKSIEQENPVPPPAPAEPQGFPSPFKQDNLWQRFLEKLGAKKRKKLDRIMQAIEKHGKITNDSVEKLLRVSDATATRYLDLLEKEGKIKQVGKTGKYTHYMKI